jgi:hypothetical protein
MVGFTIWTRVERMAPNRFVARASAIPCGCALRCAPEERTVICSSHEKAHLACIRLAQALTAAVHARGNRVVEVGVEAVAPPARPPRGAQRVGRAAAHFA